MLSYYALSALVNCLSSLFICLIIVGKNPRSCLNRSFGYFSFPVAAWSFFYFLWQANQNDASFALYYSRMLMFPAIFIPVGFFHFVVNLIGDFQKYLKILLVFYSIALIQVGLNFTPLFIAGVSPNAYSHNWSIAGPLFFTHIVLYVILVTWGLYILYQQYTKVSGNKREQIKYVFFGSVIGFLCGSLNYPLWYGIPIPPVTNILIFTYVFIFGYAIVKHQLMDIRIAIIRGAIFIAVYGAVFAFSLFLEYWLKNWLVSSVITVIIAMFAPFIYIHLQLQAERLIFKKQKLQLIAVEQNRRQRAMDNFSASLAHEIQNPVVAVIGRASMIRESILNDLKGKVDEKLIHYYSQRLEGIEEDVNRIASIIKAVREYSAQIPLKHTTINIDELIQAFLYLAGPQFKQDQITLNTDIEPNLVIAGNKVQLEEVLLNLADNAIHAVKSIEGDRQVWLTIKHNSDKTILIEFKDNGYGIPKLLLEDIFFDFVTTKGSSEGLGMGLSRARKIIAMHKGKIWARSEGEGRGAHIFVELPC